jgi:hypothetical protein
LHLRSQFSTPSTCMGYVYLHNVGGVGSVRGSRSPKRSEMTKTTSLARTSPKGRYSRAKLVYERGNGGAIAPSILQKPSLQQVYAVLFHTYGSSDLISTPFFHVAHKPAITKICLSSRHAEFMESSKQWSMGYFCAFPSQKAKHVTVPVDNGFQRFHDAMDSHIGSHWKARI